MIRIKIIKGLDLAPAESELYLTLAVKGVSKTSKIVAREKALVSKANSSIVSENSSMLNTSTSSIKNVDDSITSTRSESSSFPKHPGWIWNEELDLILPPDVKLDDDDLEVSCFDTQFKPCGKVRIPLVRLAPNESTQQWYSLTGSSNPKAAVMLKLTFIPERTNSTSPLRNSTRTPVTSPEKERASDVGSTISKGNGIKVPYGLADYFIVAGCNQETARQERLRVLAKPKKKPQTFSPRSITQMGADDYAYINSGNPDIVTLPPILIDRYPREDKPDIEFPTKVEMFLLPDGAEVVKSKSESMMNPRFYTIVLVVNTVRTYGFCLEAFEPLPSTSIDDETLYAPVVLCYLTRLPLPSDAFRSILLQTYEARKRGWYERIVQSVIRSIPVPLPGLYSVDVGLLQRPKIRLNLAEMSELPSLVFPGLSKHVFEWFPLDAIIDLWIAILTERKILVHSYNREVLAMMTETIVELMYPFTWEHTYIPVLPINLMQLFDAPIPAIMGMRTDGLKNIPNGGVEALADHWIIVDADKCTISFPKLEPLPDLPVELRARLYRTLRMILVDRHMTEEAKDRKIRLAFLECIASMLQGYRESFFVLSTDADAGTVFNQNQFFQRQASQKLHLMSQMSSHIQHPSQNNIGDGGREFLETFFSTTAFEQFKISQHHPGTDVFHAVYAIRRSKERERDQRCAALAVLQSEAESAAALQQQPQSSNPNAASYSSLTQITSVIKLWSARESRWSENALEPIDPAGGRRRSSVVMSEAVETQPPLVIGDRVYVTTFGTGTLTAIRREDLICEVTLDWGAKGYFQVESLSDLTSDTVAKPKLLTAEVDSVSSEGENGKGDATKDSSNTQGVDVIPVKLNSERFLPEPLSLADETVIRKIITEDTERANKAEAQLKRILGNATDAKRSQAGSKPPKSAADAKMERLMHRAITNIFQDKDVPENDLRECANCLANSQYARDMLVYILKSQQLIQKTSSVPGSWLATPGRGRRLGPEAFASLHDLFDALLRACAIKEDYTNGACALEVSQYFYCEDETLQNRLRGHLLWSKPVFWEYAFAQQFAASLDKEQILPSPPSLSSEQAPIEPPAIALSRFHERAKKVNPGEEEARKQALFEQLSVFLHTMLNLDVPDEMARVFVDRIAVIYGLEEDMKTTLDMLITNISRAALYNLEEERAYSHAQTDDGQASPNSTSTKRYIRKHYGEALGSNMMSRFTRWGRSSKSARSPGQGGSGRRDSIASSDH